MNGNLFLIRGLPGSGKSTFARKLVNSTGGVWFEADHYFTGNGGYHFDHTKLADAHDWCYNETHSAMDEGIGNIVVSNTFTRERELAPYVELAKHYGYQAIVLITENRHGNESVHDVPEETMAKMRNRFSIKL